ncbi:UDP-glucose 4-epimerase GalE [Enteractinococcus fodinae]|uniref:UDP-glucose 4-epimerase GalE n=1 Tax=Enteractinococcus fodinae TaxID=684663 RepID=UPI00286BAC53|nr:UDP-glucose 4-epimerase GalE [Enteractinococcus fodinae]
MRILLTGGAGYIGSHTALVLLEQGHEVVIIDDLSNGNLEALRRVERLSGKSIEFFHGDLTEPETVRKCFDGINVEAVIHLAGLKAVGESVDQPARYYRVNLGSTLTLLNTMQERGINRLVFSSSATVYGEPQTSLISESHPVGVGIANPYGWSKAMNEQIISDVARSWPQLSVTLLRYFNPVGAHHSGQIGEAPSGKPNNLMPFIAQVAARRREFLTVFGNDYDTPDGTGVRDYIHVMDLAEGHLAALLHLKSGVKTYNLGSGEGTSVLQAIGAFEKASERAIPYEIYPRRSGDLASVVADPLLAKTEIGWQTRRTFEDACRDAWTWQSLNPHGYDVAK